MNDTNNLTANDITATNVVVGQQFNSTFNLTLPQEVQRLLQSAVAAQMAGAAGEKGVTQSPALESAMVALNAKQFERAIAMAERLSSQAATEKNYDLLASAEMILGAAHNLAGRPGESVPHFERLLELLPTDPPNLTRVQVLIMLGSMHGEAGNAEAAQHSFDEARKQAARFSEPAVDLFFEQSLASWYGDRGDARAALAHLEHAEAAAKRLELPDQVAFFASQCALQHQNLKDWPASSTAAKRALSVMTENAPLILRSNALSAIVIASGALNDADALLEFGPRYIAIAMEAGNLELAAGVYQRLAMTYLERQMPARHIAALEQTVELARRLGQPDVELLNMVSLGYAYGRAGWLTLAEPLFERALLMAQLQQNTKQLALAQAGLAFAKPNRDERVAALELALTTANATHDQALIDQVSGWLTQAKAQA